MPSLFGPDPNADRDKTVDLEILLGRAKSYEALREWAEALRQEAAAADEALVVFCNCVGTQGIDNARRLAEMLAEPGADVSVVAPFAAPHNFSGNPKSMIRRFLTRTRHRWREA